MLLPLLPLLLLPMRSDAVPSPPDGTPPPPSPHRRAHYLISPQVVTSAHEAKAHNNDRYSLSGSGINLVAAAGEGAGEEAPKPVKRRFKV